MNNVLVDSPGPIGTYNSIMECILRESEAMQDIYSKTDHQSSVRFSHASPKKYSATFFVDKLLKS